MVCGLELAAVGVVVVDGGGGGIAGDSVDVGGAVAVVGGLELAAVVVVGLEDIVAVLEAVAVAVVVVGGLVRCKLLTSGDISPALLVFFVLEPIL